MLTSKSKIRLSLILVASISLGTSLVSLSYMNQIVRKIEIMTDTDAKMAEIGEALTIKMLEARREEKNFIIFLDSLYINNNFQILDEIEAGVNQARNIFPDYDARLDSITNLVRIYRENIRSLAQTFQDDPRAFYRLQQQVMQYEMELEQITKKQKTASPQNQVWASPLNYSMLSAANKLSSDKAKVITQLKETSTQILLLTQSIAVKARESLANNSQQGRQYGIRARRNILTLLMVTGLILAYLIFYLPQKIFEPFRRIQRALGAISRGAIEFSMPNMEAKDEIGELSRAFNEATKKIRYFNDLITEKLVETRRHYQRILDEVDEGVIISTTDYQITSMNQAVRELFDLKTKTEVKSIKDLIPLWKGIGSSLENIEKMGRTEFRIKLSSESDRECSVTVIPRPGKSGRLENMLFILR